MAGKEVIATLRHHMDRSGKLEAVQGKGANTMCFTGAKTWFKLTACFEIYRD